MQAPKEISGKLIRNFLITVGTLLGGFRKRVERESSLALEPKILFPGASMTYGIGKPVFGQLSIDQYVGVENGNFGK